VKVKICRVNIARDSYFMENFRIAARKKFDGRIALREESAIE
jgi:hypothetical protein